LGNGVVTAVQMKWAWTTTPVDDGWEPQGTHAIHGPPVAHPWIRVGPGRGNHRCGLESANLQKLDHKELKAHRGKLWVATAAKSPMGVLRPEVSKKIADFEVRIMGPAIF